MSLIGRLFVILLGFLAASLVAGAIVVGAVLFPALSDFADVPFDPATMRFDGIIRRHLEIMTGAGIVAGVVYWMIAGRNAGAWRAPRRVPAPAPPHIPPSS